MWIDLGLKLRHSGSREPTFPWCSEQPPCALLWNSCPGRLVSLLCVPLVPSKFRVLLFPGPILWSPESFLSSSSHTRASSTSRKLSFRKEERRKVQAWFRGEEKRLGAALCFHGNAAAFLITASFAAEKPEEGGEVGVRLSLLFFPFLPHHPFRLGSQVSWKPAPDTTLLAGFHRTPSLEAGTL